MARNWPSITGLNDLRTENFVGWFTFALAMCPDFVILTANYTHSSLTAHLICGGRLNRKEHIMQLVTW